MIDQYHLDTDQENIGTIYHVIAIPGQLDNMVAETGQPLSVFYANNPDLFGCHESIFPIRMTTTCNEGKQSYQLHPDDDYAMKRQGEKGKVSGSVAIHATDEIHTTLFGNRAKNMAEFKRMVETKDWEHLFDHLKVRDGQFVHTPAGVIHGGIGRGTIKLTFGTNGDVTYRFYDYDRNDTKRPLNLQEVYDCVNIPELPLSATDGETVIKNGVQITTYHSVPGEYVAKRIKNKDEGVFSYRGFYFITCVDGKGTICGETIKPADTLFVPVGSGCLDLSGNMDLAFISYIDRKDVNNVPD